MSILGDLTKLYELWNSWTEKKPTEPEIEILIEAYRNKGEIFIMSSGQTGEFLSIGKRDFIDENDPSVRARGLESIEKLFRRGLIRHEGGSLFCLSGSGFDAAKKFMAD